MKWKKFEERRDENRNVAKDTQTHGFSFELAKKNADERRKIAGSGHGRHDNVFCRPT